MRASEFLIERNKSGKALHTHNAASPGALSTTHPDRYYTLYRASLLMGKHPDDIKDIDIDSFLGNKVYVGTYTPEEAEMYKAACKALGIRPVEMISGPSHEPDDVNTQSAVKPFKGYPR